VRFFLPFGIDLVKQEFHNADNKLSNQSAIATAGLGKPRIYKKLARLVLNIFPGAGAPPVCTDNL
jgi:hypothetical protein